MPTITRNHARTEANKNNIAKQVLEISVVNNLVLSQLKKTKHTREIVYMKSIFRNNETYEPHINTINNDRVVKRTKEILAWCTGHDSLRVRIRYHNMIFDNFVRNKTTFHRLCKMHPEFGRTVDKKLIGYLELSHYNKKAMYYIKKLGIELN